MRIYANYKMDLNFDKVISFLISNNEPKKMKNNFLQLSSQVGSPWKGPLFPCRRKDSDKKWLLSTALNAFVFGYPPWKWTFFYRKISGFFSFPPALNICLLIIHFPPWKWAFSASVNYASSCMLVSGSKKIQAFLMSKLTSC